MRDEENIQIVELMSNLDFPFNKLLFGQTVLKMDLIREIKKIETSRGPMGVTFNLLGSKILDSDIYVGDRGVKLVNTDDPRFNNSAYKEYVEELCRTGDPVIVVSSLVHRDSRAFEVLADLKRKYNNLALIAILHCTMPEYFHPIIDIEESNLDEESAETVAKQNEFSMNMRLVMYRLVRDGLIDHAVTVSEASRLSYGQVDPYLNDMIIPPDKIEVIYNGVDDTLYDISPQDLIEQRKRKVGLDDTFVVGTTCRFEQVKGKDIISDILRRYEESSENITFMMPGLPLYTTTEFIEFVKEYCPRLFREGRIKLFVDTYKLQNSEIPYSEEEITQNIDNFRKSLSQEDQDYFDRMFIGVVNFPMQSIFNVYIRPSIMESFGRGVVESYLSGVPVVASKVGGLEEIVFQEDLVDIPSSVSIHNRCLPYRTEEYNAGAMQAADRFIDRIEYFRKNGLRGDERVRYRERVLSLGLTTSRMIKEYKELYKRCVEDMRVK